MAEDASEAQVIQELTRLAQGFDVYDRRIPYPDQLKAMQQLEELRRRRDESNLAKERLNISVEIERSKMAAAAETERTKTEIEHRKLDIDQERVATERAAVLVKALEVAAHAGVSGDRLIEAIANLSEKLLPGGRLALPMAAVHQIEKKD